MRGKNEQHLLSLWSALDERVSQASTSGFPFVATFLDRCCHRVRDDFDRLHGVVVGWNWVVNVSWVHVRVTNRDHLHATADRFGEGRLVLADVEDEHRIRDASEFLDTTNTDVHEFDLFRDLELFELGVLAEFALFLLTLQILETANRLSNAREVRERATEPAVVDVWHATGLCRSFHERGGLLLRTNEEDHAATSGRLLCEGEGFLEGLLRGFEVQDVDTVAFTEDELLHLWVPFGGLVTEVRAGLQKVDEGWNVCHSYSPFYSHEKRSRLLLEKGVDHPP